MTDPALPTVALSVKQPWAALLAAGVKTVEVRTWPTSRRGPVCVHAAKVPDDRPHGWTFVDTPALIRSAELVGGIVAVGELVDCVTYSSAEAFAADAARHRNLPSWFQPPVLYGFVFENVRPVAFRAVTGNTFFFPVSTQESPHPAAARPPSPSETVSGADGGRGLKTEDEQGFPDSFSPLPPSRFGTVSEGEGPGVRAELSEAAPHSITSLPPPAERVIIIDPPEGKDARHHDYPDHPQDRPAG